MSDAAGRRRTALRLTDAAPAVVMLVLSVVITTDTLPLGMWQGFTPGPAFFPVLIAGFTAILAAQLLLKAWLGPAPEATDWPGIAVLRTIGLVYAGLLGFFFLTPVLGMIPAITLFLLTVMIGILRQPAVGSLIASAVTTVLIYVVFVLWLGLPLPKGFLGL